MTRQISSSSVASSKAKADKFVAKRFDSSGPTTRPENNVFSGLGSFRSWDAQTAGPSRVRRKASLWAKSGRTSKSDVSIYIESNQHPLPSLFNRPRMACKSNGQNPLRNAKYRYIDLAGRRILHIFNEIGISAASRRRTRALRPRLLPFSCACGV